jgi:hypothetical protein
LVVSFGNGIDGKFANASFRNGPEITLKQFATVIGKYRLPTIDPAPGNDTDPSPARTLNTSASDLTKGAAS